MNRMGRFWLTVGLYVAGLAFGTIGALGACEDDSAGGDDGGSDGGGSDIRYLKTHYDDLPLP